MSAAMARVSVIVTLDDAEKNYNYEDKYDDETAN